VHVIQCIGCRGCSQEVKEQYGWPFCATVGQATAWDVMREVAAREVLAVDAWQGLAAWAVQQLQGPAEWCSTHQAAL